MDISTTSVIDKIRTRDENPLEYDELVLAWNNLCEQAWRDNSDDSRFAHIENAAIAALSDEPEKTRPGYITNEIGRMLSAFDFPTYLVNAEGRVAAINNTASLEFNLNVGDTIDLIPYSFDGSELISTLVRDSLKANCEEHTDVTLKRAHGTDDKRDATIAITASHGSVSTALVFVVTTHWKPKSTKLLQRQFQFTDAELDVLVNFIDGYSTQDIAKLRKRSHATIRTQLQSLLTKTGTHNQIELLRTILSVSDFVKNIGPITDAVNHPYRRRAEILREGGRKIEVTLMGDLSGSPILTVASISVYTCNAQIEQKLFDSQLYIISVCTPGSGKTDPIPTGANRLDYISEDVNALLDHLKIDRCPLLALTNNTPICYALAKRLPERFSHLVQITASVPPQYTSVSSTQSPWVTGVVRASTASPAMKKILLKGAIKAWATIGARQFIRLQLHSNPIDAQHAFLPENLKENEHALQTATIGGISATVDDIALAFEDWSEDIEASPVELTILHGESDQLFPVENVRLFAEYFSHKAKLIEIPNAGFTLIQSHTDIVMELLSSVVETYS